MEDEEKRRLDGIESIAEFINAHAHDEEERKKLHDYLSYFEAMSEIKKISEHAQEPKVLDKSGEKKAVEIAKSTEISVSPESKPKYMLLEKTKALYTMVQPYLDQFPKVAKFTLRARIENSIMNIMKLLITQNYKQTDDERRKVMLNAIADIHLTGVLLQQAMIFKYISFSNYENVSRLMKEITAIATARYRNLGGKNENL